MIYIGKYSNTHGLKGEIRILSNFSRKDLVFKIGNTIYIDHEPYIIKTYRVHKNYDMVTFENIDNINNIEHLKGKDVYIKNVEADYLIEDFASYKAILNNKEIAIKEIIENKKYKILVLSNNKMIPLIEEFVEKIDSDSKKIYIREGIDI